MWPLLSLAVAMGHLSWARALAVGAANPARCYGIPCRGELVHGARADLVFLRRRQGVEGRRSASFPGVISRARSNPYFHLPLAYEVERVLLAGQPAWESSDPRALSLAEEVYAIAASL